MLEYLIGGLAVLAVLWFLDEVLTSLDVKKYGLKAEANPIMRYFIKEGHSEPFYWKVFSYFVFVGIIAVLYYFEHIFALAFLGIVIALYLFVDLHNLERLEGN